MSTGIDLNQLQNVIVDANQNIFIGEDAGESNIDGTHNIYIGSDAGDSNVSGIRNVAVGVAAFAGASVGSSNNTAIGFQALSAVEGDGFNTGVGHQAGYQITTGIDNVCIGTGAGGIETGDGNIAIGASVEVPDPDADGQINIGGKFRASATGVSFNAAMPSTPVIDATATNQSIADALVALGLCTQAAP